MNEAEKRLKPRLYQLELVRRAEKENIIIFMDTGGGKTLVAAMLMESMMKREAMDHPFKAIFLVNKKILGIQQSRALTENLSADVRVSNYSGSTNLDSWDKNRWAKQLDGNEVLVMTSGILLHLLRHAFFQLSNVSLLVFDECHAARKSAPMNLIMSEFYHLMEPRSRPKILGLTASPVSTGGKSLEDLCRLESLSRELERNLNSKIVAVERSSLEKYVSRPVESTRFFSPSPQKQIEAISKVENLLGARLQGAEGHICRIGMELLKELGSWCAVEFVRSMICNIQMGTFAKSKSSSSMHYSLSSLSRQADYESVFRMIYFMCTVFRVYNFDDSDPFCANLSTCSNADIESLCEMLAKDVMGRGQSESESSNCFSFASIPVFTRPSNSLHLSSQVGDLILLLTEFNKTMRNLCGIVFVEKRVTALLLSELLNCMFADFDDSLEASSESKCVQFSVPLTGTDRRLNQISKASKSRGSDPIDQFRQGKVKILVSTSVAEEGLDIPSCKLVVRFNPLQTLVSYLQSRGRARHLDSTYIIMAERGDPGQENVLSKLKRSEEAMRGIRIIQDDSAESRIRLIELDALFNHCFYSEQYIVPSTGAKVTLSSAVSLLHSFCDLLPHDKYSEDYSRPVFEFEEVSRTSDFGNVVKECKCIVLLPSGCPMRRFESAPKMSKKIARQSACLGICRRLHELGVLDDSLVPIHTLEEIRFLSSLEPLANDEEFSDENMGCLKSIRSYTWNDPSWTCPLMTKLPPFVEYFVYSCTCSIDPTISHCFLSAIRQPQIRTISFIYLGQTFELNLSYQGTFKFSSSECVAIQKYFSTLLSAIWPSGFFTHFSSTHDRLPPMMIAPRNVTGDFPYVDWEEISRTLDEGSLMNSFTVNDFFRNCHGSFSEVFESLKERIVINKAVAGRMVPVAFIKDLCMPNIEIFRNNVFANTLETIVKKKLKSPGICDGQVVVVCMLAPSVRGIRSTSDKSIPSTGDNDDDVTISVEHVEGPNYKIFSSKRPDETLRYIAPLENVVVHPIKLNVVRSGVAFGLLLFEAEQRLVVRSCVENILPQFRDLELLRFALSTPSCQLEISYERFETLGDSILKYLATFYLTLKFPHFHEGRLTVEKCRIISNKNLFEKAVALNLPNFILSEGFVARKFIPFGFELPNQVEKTRNLADKTIADVMESLIAATYLDSNRSMRQVWESCMIGFGLIKSGEHFPDPLLYVQRFSSGQIRSPDFHFQEIEGIMQYEFNHKYLLVEACTHASIDISVFRDASVDSASSYQRLEFLGDAVLDFVITNYLFEWNSPILNPGEITDWRSLTVSNDNLALCTVRLNLHKFLRYENENLRHDIDVFVASQLDSGFAYSHSVEPKAPKVLGDVLEALIGAMFLDCGGDLDVVTRFIHRHIIHNQLDRNLGSVGTRWGTHRHPVSIVEEIKSAARCRQFRVVYSVNRCNDALIDCAFLVHDCCIGTSCGSDIANAKQNTCISLLDEFKPEGFLTKLHSLCDCF